MIMEFSPAPKNVADYLAAKEDAIKKIVITPDMVDASKQVELELPGMSSDGVHIVMSEEWAPRFLDKNNCLDYINIVVKLVDDGGFATTPYIGILDCVDLYLKIEEEGGVDPNCVRYGGSIELKLKNLGSVSVTIPNDGVEDKYGVVTFKRYGRRVDPNAESLKPLPFPIDGPKADAGK
jgi:hypothetical protein